MAAHKKNVPPYTEKAFIRLVKALVAPKEAHGISSSAASIH
jgi:hypothetical protein